MATTRLGSDGLPSKPQAFTAKSAAVGAKGIGPFTTLSPTAVSSKRYVFTAKTAVGAGVKGTGPFTRLSVMSLPGQLRTFIAKTGADVQQTKGGSRKGRQHYLKKKIHLVELLIDEEDLIPTPAPLYIEIDEEQYEISATPIDTLTVAYEQLEDKEVILSALSEELEVGIEAAKEQLRMLLAFELAEMKAVQELLQEDDAIALILIAATIH